MNQYTVWYKKEIKADNIKKAINLEAKKKAVFHSIVKEDEPEIQQGVSAIGFEVEGYYD